MKPHMFHCNDEWWCCGRGYMGRGPTPFHAWKSWLTISLSRYSFETS